MWTTATRTCREDRGSFRERYPQDAPAPPHAEGGAPGDPLPRPPAHVRYALALEEPPSEDSLGDAGARERGHHPQHLQPRLAGNGRSGGVGDGERPTIARHCQVTVKRGWDLLRPLLHFCGCSANRSIFEVESRGFEPLTSAVQRQIHNVAIVRLRSKSAAKLRIYLLKYSWVFAVVRVGWCITGVDGSRYEQRAATIMRKRRNRRVGRVDTGRL
jgi:hypothetical protein